MTRKDILDEFLIHLELIYVFNYSYISPRPDRVVRKVSGDGPSIAVSSKKSLTYR